MGEYFVKCLILAKVSGVGFLTCSLTLLPIIILIYDFPTFREIDFHTHSCLNFEMCKFCIKK